MNLSIGTTLHGFAIEKRESLPEIDGTAYVGRHAESGARLLYLQNDDNNKSFAIGFRTPPQDDTGVFHILEHSVLCGSRRFPVKEPFVDLLKGSMQTFLNAMTFSDKTLYPVASTNEQDLRNLMDVYLDAVFHPNIYEKRQIFEQEGWHYELAGDEQQLVYNGVVFNEMKGALSDANSVLYDELQALLFPGTCYAFESGGKPEAIPTLTYEGYLDEHRRHYRTDNSYIILYGNLDIERTLAFLDERYLVPVAAEQRERDAAREAAGLEPLVPRAIGRQCAIAGKTRVPMKTAPENACLGVGYVVGSANDRTRLVATDILLDALLGSNEAPLKRALLDLGIAHEIHAFVSEAVLQPFVVVQMQMPAKSDELSHSAIIEREVRKLLDEGLDHELIEAALSNQEFQMREHDFGMSDGVVYAMTALSGWLYDDDAATTYLRYENVFAELREKLESGYFEDLARTLFCENGHMGQVEIVPTPDMDDRIAEQLAAVDGTLGADDRERIVAEEALLRDLQEAPDAPEAVATLPRLSVSDIDDAPVEPAYGLVEGSSQPPLPCLRHEVPTHGIAYAYRYFDMDRIAFEDLPYVSLLALSLGKLGTARHTAAEIDTLTQGKLGNLSFFTSLFDQGEDPAAVRPMFAVSSSALADNAEWLATLPREVMLETDFTDTARILDLLKQQKIGMEQGFANAGHSCAVARARSYYSPAGVVKEQLSNVDFYRFLCALIEHFDERADELAARLAELAAQLFCDDNCTVSFAGDDGAFDAFWRADPTCGRVRTGTGRLVIPEPQLKREAFIVPSDVCFASLGWDRRLLGAPHTGTWGVAARALSYDYLWNEVRVKGGAYGVGFKVMLPGDMRFYSYRDPHLDETIARFESCAPWLASFDPSAEDMEGYVVASVASIDAPMKARGLVRRQAGDFFSGRTPETRAENRRQVIATDVEAVRGLADTLGRIIEPHALCVFGNREILESSTAGFDVIPLVG